MTNHAPHLHQPHPATGIRIELGTTRHAFGDPALIDRLDAGERIRLGAFRRPDDAARFALGRVLLREAVATDTGLAPSDVRIGLSPRGRPRLVGFPGGRPSGSGARPGSLADPFADPAAEPSVPPPHISIAHAGNLVGVALAHGWEVGLDLEPLAAASPDLATLACTPRERSRLAGLRPRVVAETALVAWTLKEAFAKLVGAGLAIDPARTDLSRIAGRPGVGLWTALVALADGPYWVAVATRGPVDAGILDGPAFRLHLRGAAHGEPLPSLERVDVPAERTEPERLIA